MASIGIGTYLLSVVWFTALMLVWINIRTGYSIGKLCLLGSVFFTIILLSLPKIDVDLPLYNDKLYEKFYATRYVTLTVIVVGNLAGAAYSYFFSCLEPLEFRKIRSFGR